MGTKFAHVYATLVIGYLEEKKYITAKAVMKNILGKQVTFQDPHIFYDNAGIKHSL